ncbi:hypothetical protein Ddc_14040 [Ditylenchus destructor]|nr:hypothetical protein Ddc_14040 [Ditylenchus destructor]
MSTANRPYVTYINFGEGIITVIAQSICISSMGHLLYCAAFGKNRANIPKLSSSIIVFLATQTILHASCLPYHIYMMIFWGGSVNNYDTYSLFWLGISTMMLITVQPVPVFFLTLDRCLVLKMPLRYTGVYQRWIVVASIVTIVSVLIVSLICTLVELPLPVEKLRNCALFSCLLLKSKAYVAQTLKIFFGTTNLLASIYFLYALRTAKADLKNRVIKITLIVEMCLNLFPTYVVQMFNIIVGETWGSYFGNTQVMCCTCEAAFCGIFYSKVFLKQSVQVKAPVPGFFTTSIK